MLIIQDTREKEGKKEHILKTFRIYGYDVVREKIDVGDYMFSHENKVSVDVKESMLEVVSNLTKQHERFKKELIRANENGKKLFILVEEPLKSVYSVQFWKSPVYKFGKLKGKPITNINSTTLMKMMITIQNKYGCEFVFCKKEDSGKKILELLRKENEYGGQNDCEKN